MGKFLPIRIGSLRWFAGWLCLCLYVAAAFQPASVAAAAVFLAGFHGHEHEVAVRVDGQHFDLVLSHHDGHPASDDHHAWPAGIFTALAATHDHEGNDHVLHFTGDTTSDPVNARIGVSRTAALQFVLPAAGTVATQPSLAAASLTGARPPPWVAPSLVCLRSVVLLV